MSFAPLLAAPAMQPHALMCLVSIGIALAFWAADRDSPTSRALALALASMGLGMYLTVNFVGFGSVRGLVSGALAVPEAVSMGAYLEWLLRVRRTVPARNLDVRGGDVGLRFGQAMAALYAVFALLWPEQRVEHFLSAATKGRAVLHEGGFWRFATPVLLVTVAAGFAVLLLMRRRPERAERLRVLAFAAATPFFVAHFVLPLDYSAFSTMFGLMIMLAGGVQYHVLQGQRGVFLSRFLSPQVAEIVANEGLKGAMRQAQLEITVVNCDLRGFTSYAQAHASSRVIEVLSDYYAEVGKVVAEYGGTIKDYAGDGILVLVGAPLAQPDHAAKGLAMADGIRRAGAAITRRWSTRKARLGIGVGVASGTVTVGVIGSASRLEYTAVGSAVNLAARLCEEASDQQILVAPRTAELAGAAAAALVATPVPAMKGFSQLDAVWALPAGAAVGLAVTAAG